MSKLILIPTPIGNLEDITLRAIRLLKEVDLILAEDTRVAKKLLNHFSVVNQLKSYHQHNEHKTFKRWVKFIKCGNAIALISDAGTPAISDPGFLLVRECILEGVEIESLPGPTAFLPALLNSGIPTDKFVFEGFLPLKKGRKNRLEFLTKEDRTMVFYESPHRIIKTLMQFAQYFGENRKVAICRELTKLHEETIRGTLASVSAHFEKHNPRGEFVIILSGK